VSKNEFIDPLVQETPDTGFDDALRPRTFSEFTGQKEACRRLELMVQAARQRGDFLDHILLNGPPGLGKATLAYIIAAAMGVNIKSTSGTMIEEPGDLAGLLVSLERGDILFIEEVHRLKPDIEQYLCQAMQGFKLDIIIDQGPQPRSIQLSLPTFTLIGTITGVEMMSASLRSRFGVTCLLNYYTAEELQTIVTRSAGIIGVPIDACGVLEIATRSQGTPRIANKLLRRAAPRLRLTSAISRSAWDEIPDLITGELWALVEARPDFQTSRNYRTGSCRVKLRPVASRAPAERQ